MDFKNLKEYLPNGSIYQVAEKHKVSRQYISKVISGKAKRPDILGDLIKSARRYKELMEEARSI